MPGAIYERAINPKQYDLPDLHWDNEIGLAAPTRKFIYDNLLSLQQLWVGADVLDVGCGTGWLLDLMQKAGARSVEGFDPGENNIRLARQHFPQITFHCADVEHFVTAKQYDLILATNVFVHVADVSEALRRLAGWLKPAGEIQIIVPDFHYFKKSRAVQDAQYENISAEEYVGQITREQGVLADIIRTTKYYARAARTAGLIMFEDRGLTPTGDLMKSMPRYEKFKDTPILQLYRLRSGKQVPQ